MHLSGVNPRPPAQALRDGSDADDACDAVLGISLHHIPDSASFASSASFLFVFFVVSLFSSKPVAHCPRHSTITMTVMTMMTVFVGYGKGVYQKHRHHRQHRHETGKSL